MPLKPWFKVVDPREDLREGRPLDASEFAVHLDKVRLKCSSISKDYIDPKRFFDRTFLTENLGRFAGEVVRRLSGINTEASAVYNTMTSFGGGKTHALTLLYHLASRGSESAGWRDVSKILLNAGDGVDSVPDNSAVAVFVGTEFDSLMGRGGSDGTPLRRTPWGEIAFQLGGEEAFAHVAQHDAEFIEPKGDVIEKFLPANQPALILMDEVLSYFSTYRARGYGTKLYNFIQSLSETCRGRHKTVMVVSAPWSNIYNYTPDDVADLNRIEALMRRLSKSVALSGEADASEIVRRRLFEFDPRAVGSDGRMPMPQEAHDAAKAYSDWIRDHRQQLPDLINVDHARDQFLSCYPFHPMVMSVFERKWDTLPSFQRTRGMLRVLALWVSKAWEQGQKKGHMDPLITLGTAPLEDLTFRSAVFEQLGSDKLEAAVTTDISGRKDSHALILDAEAVDSIKKARLHQKAATAVFFESNGGQVGKEAKDATMGEVRLAVGEPGSDIGNIETVVNALSERCYYLTQEKNRFRFGIKENLNKRFTDRRANINSSSIEEEVKAEILRVFKTRPDAERTFFPGSSSAISDRPAINFVIGGLDKTMADEGGARSYAEQLIRESGSSNRTFKSAVIVVIADTATSMLEEARKLLAWQTIKDELSAEGADFSEEVQIKQNVDRARRDLKEAVWRSYKHVMLLGKDNKVRVIDQGMPHSSSADSPLGAILDKLKRDDEVTAVVTPNTLTRNWPPAFIEWSTKSVRDAFFSSPLFPRILQADLVKEAIAKGVSDGRIGYVQKTGAGSYDPFIIGEHLSKEDVEFSDDVFIIQKATADAHKKKMGQTEQSPGATGGKDEAPDSTPPDTSTVTDESKKSGQDQLIQPELFTGVEWEGDVSPQKWMLFYNKVVAKLNTGSGLKLHVRLEASPEGGVSKSKVQEATQALQELGLSFDIKTK